ncbi:hypothetical protein DPMN_053519 [Dreissena polymorpha]|uniref:Uncharacterized protein n=1 Tax=Dreissena polymorpha TaxID=45954 RepID=A0A9D4CNS9_DREPO|nr:hypothetical protein DPMN_053519 [Dreissena polymorpha]
MIGSAEMFFLNKMLTQDRPKQDTKAQPEHFVFSRKRVEGSSQWRLHRGLGHVFNWAQGLRCGCISLVVV